MGPGWRRPDRRAVLWAGRVPIRCLVVYGLGVVLVAVPMRGVHATAEVPVLDDRAIAAVVAGDGDGFVLDRGGDVIRVARDGSLRLIGSVGRYSTPFGTSVRGHVVVGGIRCDGPACRGRAAEIAVIDRGGEVDRLVLDRSSASRSPLDGLALVGRDRESVWVNGGGALFQVVVASARVIARVPWPGGEPCVVDGVLYDLSASGGTYGRRGADVAAGIDLLFDLHLRAWDGQRWRLVPSAATSMAYGQNAYCSPAGYEIRDSYTTFARWDPDRRGWRPVDAGRDSPPGMVSPVTSSTHRRYFVTADGSLVDVTRPESPRRTPVVVPEVASGDAPPALQVDDAGRSLFWCSTSYRFGSGRTHCSVAAESRSSLPSSGLRASVVPAGEWPTDQASPSLTGGHAGRPVDTPPSVSAHHYNLCSAACGDGARPHSRDLVAWLVDHHRPLGLSLNESCYDDEVHLAGRLPPGLDRGASYAALAIATGCPGAVKQFGNLVRVRSSGETYSSWAQFPSQATRPCDHRQHECRGVACVESRDGVDTDRGGLVFCSAHLESERRAPGLAEIQAGEYRDLVASRYGAAVVRVLAGDFNLIRRDADAHLAPGGYRAATTGPTLHNHPPASEPIDMIYLGRPDERGRSGAGRSTGATYCDLQASDHCYVMAR